MKFTKTKFYSLICIIFLIASCTLTTTKTKTPVFRDAEKVKNDLTVLVKAENINLAGKEVSVNKRVTSELEVNVTNGQNIPTGSEERKALGRSIAITIKSNLQDPGEYDKYTVLFVTKQVSNGVTTRKWIGDVFNSKEL